MGLLDRFLGKPTLDRFAAQLMQALGAAGVPDELRYDADAHRIYQYRNGEMVGTINLDNMFRTYVEKPPAERPDYLRFCVRSATSHLRGLPEDFEAAQPDLRPKLWIRAMLEAQRLRARLGEPCPMDLACEPIGAHLLASLVFDWPESVQSIGNENLRQWDVTFYEAMEAARRNLEEVSSRYAKIGEHLYAFLSGDSYDASRLLLVDRIRELELLGHPVAMAPNRDSLLVTGSEDEVGLEIMAELAAKGLQESYPMSALPLILGADGWADWMPPREHPLYRRFHELYSSWIGSEYATQKELLDAVHEREGVDIFVASFSAIKKQDDELVSYCVWSEGVDTLLPVAQKVVFMRAGHEGPVALGEWERVLEVAEELMEPTDYYPVRYRVRTFPDEAVLALIGTCML